MKQSIENLYKLDGRVPVGKALPFGLQHVLAMFVSNIAPIMILAGAVGLDSSISAVLIQNCMVIAGIGTLVQLYPVWRIGSRLPIVMGISFTFLSLAIALLLPMEWVRSSERSSSVVSWKVHSDFLPSIGSN